MQEYWSRCNYKTESQQPITTATSLYRCNVCNYVRECAIKSKTQTWQLNPVVKELIDRYLIKLKEQESELLVK